MLIFLVEKIMAESIRLVLVKEKSFHNGAKVSLKFILSKREGQ